MPHSTHSVIHRAAAIPPRPTAAIFVSQDVAAQLPLYCPNIELAQARIASLFRTHDVVHNRVYALTDAICSPRVDLVVLVTVTYPRLATRIPGNVLVISVDGGDICLHDVVRSRSMYALAEVLKKGRWVRWSAAMSAYQDPMPFQTACDVALRLGHISKKGDALMLR